MQNGEKVVYQTSQGEKLLDGEVRVSRQGPCGILCGCCSQVISCSQFEAHAGRGSRRSALLLEPNSTWLQSVYGRSPLAGEKCHSYLRPMVHCCPHTRLLSVGSSHPPTDEVCGRVRRAPYDNIFTMAGMSLRRLAAALPSEVAIYHAEAEQE